MTNRIGGDYSAEAIEAFRAAYANQMRTPEDLDVDQISGLPTSNISNTSPWIAHTGLWSYPSGKGPEDNLRQPPVQSQPFPEAEDEDEEITDEQIEKFLSSLDESQLDEILQEMGISDDSGESEEEIEELSDSDIDALIDELLNDPDEK